MEGLENYMKLIPFQELKTKLDHAKKKPWTYVVSLFAV